MILVIRTQVCDLYVCSEEHPNSYWQCYSVLWDDGATDLLSPWDMEPLQNGEEGEEEGEYKGMRWEGERG